MLASRPIILEAIGEVIYITRIDRVLRIVCKSHFRKHNHPIITTVINVGVIVLAIIVVVILGKLIISGPVALLETPIWEVYFSFIVTPVAI